LKQIRAVQDLPITREQLTSASAERFECGMQIRCPLHNQATHAVNSIMY